MEHSAMMCCGIFLLSTGYFFYALTNSILVVSFGIFCNICIWYSHNPEPSNGQEANNVPSDLLQIVLDTYTILLNGISAWAVGHVVNLLL